MTVLGDIVLTIMLMLVLNLTNQRPSVNALR